MTAIRLNNISDFSGANGITFADSVTTTGDWITSPPFPDIASGDFARVVINGDTVLEEIAWLNGPFTAGDTSSPNFTRAAEPTALGQTAFACTNAPWRHGPTTLDFIPNFLGEGSPENSHPALFGQTYQDVSGYDGSAGSTSGLYIFTLPNSDGVAATAFGDNPATLPLTVVTGVNDEFVYTPIATGTPETFTIAAGTYSTFGALAAAIDAALGISAEAFSTIATASNAGGGQVRLTTVAISTANTGDTFGPGANDVSVALGFTENPNVFSNAVNPLTGWAQLGGTPGGPPVLGLQTFNGRSVLLGSPNGAVIIQDVLANDGTDNGLFWESTFIDGQQTFFIRLGSTGQFDWNWQDDGSMQFPGVITLDVTVDGGNVSLFAFAGNPNTHVSPRAVGDVCFDPSTPAIWQNTNGLNTGWVPASAAAGSVPTFSGSGSPEGVQVASAQDQTYLDLTNGGLYFFIGIPGNDTGWAAGVGSAVDWQIANGIAGVGFVGSGELVAAAPAGGTWVLTDVSAAGVGNSNNGLTWNATSGDGNQTLELQLGGVGTPKIWLFSNNGETQLGGPLLYPFTQGTGAIDPFASPIWLAQGAMTLPDLTTWGQVEVTVKNTTGSPVTVTPNGTDPIDGTNTAVTLAAEGSTGDCATFYSDGISDIFVVSRS